MREARERMGMPVIVEAAGIQAPAALEKVFDYFLYVDRTFSTYKTESEISRINRGELNESEYSKDMKDVFTLAEGLKKTTKGFFDMRNPHGLIDPSGLVKGWAINNAAGLLRSLGYVDFYVEVGGDIQTSGKNSRDKEWRIGIRNPFDQAAIVKVVFPHGRGVATSGTAARGEHIYDPHTGKPVITDIVSLTVIGPDVYEADCFATAAFAMGNRGISFIESLDGFEGYAVDKQGVATMTTRFNDYTHDQGD